MDFTANYDLRNTAAGSGCEKPRFELSGVQLYPADYDKQIMKVGFMFVKQNKIAKSENLALGRLTLNRTC